MKFFKASEMNRPFDQFTMIILSENDIVNESMGYLGTGIDILVVPLMYKYVSNSYIETIKEFTRYKIIYV